MPGIKTPYFLSIEGMVWPFASVYGRISSILIIYEIGEGPGRGGAAPARDFLQRIHGGGAGLKSSFHRFLIPPDKSGGY